MIEYQVDPNNVAIDLDAVAAWALFYLECHGGAVVLTPDHAVRIDLNAMSGMTAETAARWSPVLVLLIPRMRGILLARRSNREAK